MLEGGRGLRIGIVPEAKDYSPGIRWNGSLWVLALPDPDGFMGLFNDAYSAVAQAVCTLGEHERPPYFLKPSWLPSPHRGPFLTGDYLHHIENWATGPAVGETRENPG